MGNMGVAETSIAYQVTSCPEDVCLLTKQDISTLVEIGHFYCGLTAGSKKLDVRGGT
jgi:hypothetical protein